MSETPNGAVKTNFAQHWKRKTEIVEFPSGGSIEMTRPNALSIISDDNMIPDMFLGAMLEAQSGKNPMEGLDAAGTRQFLKTLAYLVEQLAVHHFVTPRVVIEGEPSEDELSLEDVRAMDMQDKQFLVNWAMNGGSPTELLARFRKEQARILQLA